MSSPVGAELRRAIPFCRRIHLTGYPMRLPRRPTDASSPAPVARLPARSHRCSLQTPDPVARPGDPQPSVRPPRSPGSASPMPRRLPRRFTGGGNGSSSYQPRLRLVSPVGPPPLLDRHCWLPRFGGTVPRAPVGVALTGMAHTLPARSYLVKRYFSTSQGYPRTFPVTPRTFSFVHCSHTSCSQPRRNSRARTPLR